jgi:hypothetical protein
VADTNSANSALVTVCGAIEYGESRTAWAGPSPSAGYSTGPSEPIMNGSTGMSISVREATAVGRSSSSWIAMSVRSAVSIVLRSGVQHSVIIEPLVGDPSAAASADPDVIEST